MTLKNTASQSKRLVVEVDFVYMDNLDFYLWENGKLIKSFKGFSWKTPSIKRPIPHRVFAIDFETAPKNTYMWAISIEKHVGALPVPVRLVDYHLFEHISKINYNTHAFSVGIMFLAVIIGLALYALSLEIMYAYYSGYISSLAGMVLGEQGYFNQYFLPINEWLPTPNVWIYFMATGIFFHIQFSLIFLGINKLKTSPWLKAGKVLKYASIGLLILAMIPDWADTIYETALLMGIFFNFLNIAYILIAFNQRNPVSLYYLIAVAPFTICTTYICFSTLGVLPESWLVFELFNYGPVWEILVLSVVVCFDYQNSLLKQNEARLALSISEAAKLAAINDAQEIDRQRIARELHDSLGALASALKLNWGGYNNSDNNVNNSILNTTSNLLDHLTNEIRRVSHELMPSSLKNNGLVAALDEIYSNHNTPVIRIISDHYNRQSLSEKQEITVLRVIQELITNSLRHANASEISVQLVSEEQKVSIIYEDDGKGLSNLDSFNGMGYQNICSRLKYLQGKMEIQSSPERGFICLIEIPI